MLTDKPGPDHFNLQGLDYFVPWAELPLYSSFFIPTVASRKEVLEALAPIRKRYGIRLTPRQRVEFGALGFRIWRAR